MSDIYIQEQWHKWQKNSASDNMYNVRSNVPGYDGELIWYILVLHTWVDKEHIY